jgi:hypothetical protein
MNEFEHHTTDELRALGRACVERITALMDVEGVAQDEVDMQKQRANRILAEIRRRRT